MSHEQPRHDLPRRRSKDPLPLAVEPIGGAEKRIHDAVADCVQNALVSESAPVAVMQYVEQLIAKHAWTKEDAHQVGARAIGVINAMKNPQQQDTWG